MFHSSPENSERRQGINAGRLLVFTGLFLALTAAGIYTVYSAVAGHEFRFDARLLSPPALAAVAGLLVLYFMSDGLRLHYTLRALDQHLPLALIMRLVFVNIFFSNVTPLASGGGFAQIWFLQRKGVPLGTATAAATVRTLLAIIFIFSAAPLVLVFFVPNEVFTPGRTVILSLSIFILAYAAFFVVLLFRARWLIAPLSVALHRMRNWNLIGANRYRRWQYASKRETLRFSKGFRSYLRGAPKYVLLSILFTLFFLLCLFSFPAVLLWALNYDIAYLRTIALTALTTFVMYFSPTPGASGIAEGVFGKLFAGVIESGHVLLITLAWRFLTIHLGMIAGIYAIHHELASKEQR